MEILFKIVKKSSDEVRRLNAVEFIDFCNTCFSVQLQKCNTNIISKKLLETTAMTFMQGFRSLCHRNVVTEALVVEN